MTNWRVSIKEFIPANNITRVTLTEDVNWQRVVVNIAGNLVTDSDESIIDKAVGAFIKRERPDFAQEIVDQSVDEIRKDLKQATVGLETLQDELLSTQVEVEGTKEELTGTKEELGQTQADLSNTIVDLVGTQVGLAETKEDLESTQVEFTQTKQVVADMKAQVDTLVVSISNLTKEQEEALADKYDPWEVGITYSAGDKVHYESVNYEVLQEHTSQDDWLPSDTPSMYKVIKNDDIETDEGTVEVIDEFEANSTNPYSIGDKVTFQGKVYESTIDNNVWSPTDHPQGWKEVTE